MRLSPTAEKAIRAYGGAELWLGSAALQAQVSVTGLAFTLKRRPFFRQAHIAQDIHRPFSRLTPIGHKADLSGVLNGADVYLQDSAGAVSGRREDAKAQFGLLRKQFRWDDLDMAYFANYAFWNYFTLPALLLREDILWRELSVGALEATFPSHLPTHCQVQRFHFDRDSGLLRQHDYTAEVIGGFARAANQVLAHSQNAGGLVYPSVRRVTPRGPGGLALGWPSLISIQVHDFALQDEPLPA